MSLRKAGFNTTSPKPHPYVEVGDRKTGRFSVSDLHGFCVVLSRWLSHTQLDIRVHCCLK